VDQAKEKEGIKAEEDELHADWAKLDAEQEKCKADMMKAYEKKWMAEQKADQDAREAEGKGYEKRMVEQKADQEKRKAERKAYEKMMAERKADQERREAERKAWAGKRMAERKADQEKWESERNFDREAVTRLVAVHDKTVSNQMRVEPETTSRETGCLDSKHKGLSERKDILPRNDGGMSRMQGAKLSGHEGLPRDDRLPRSDGGRYREDSARSKNDAVHSGASRSPQKRHCGDAGRRTDEEA
jgi:hypothetical protein